MTFLAIGLFIAAGFAACLVASVMFLASEARHDSGFCAHEDAGTEPEAATATADVIDPLNFQSLE